MNNVSATKTKFAYMRRGGKRKHHQCYIGQAMLCLDGGWERLSWTAKKSCSEVSEAARSRREKTISAANFQSRGLA